MADVDVLLLRLAQGVVRDVERGVPLPVRLCRAAVDILECDGAAMTLAYTHLERVTLCATDDTALAIEETQDVLGQGPGHDAFRTRAYVRLDLMPEDAGPDPRWPLLKSEELSALAPVVVHALPMGEGSGTIGVLTLYRRGRDADLDIAAGLLVAQVLAAALLADAPTLERAGYGEWSDRALVHQATGMVVAQLGLPVADALALIRAHAYAHDHSVGETAREVVDHELTFSGSPDEDIEST
ncbi:GAF domain-containing protein [Fodinibacter luteus]|uniref:GAF domain-containing protein n=1 Tax=Fodinibacter luteus TaxID=552064 RepID=A0ABP8KD24_9MICO